jgi:hypothetical protein
MLDTGNEIRDTSVENRGSRLYFQYKIIILYDS